MVGYKILSSSTVKLRSIHYGYEYTLGKLENSPLIRGGSTIYEGFHSFTSLASAEDAFAWFKFLSPGIDMDIDNMHIYRVIVPAGSKYYCGKYRSYRNIASNQIIIENKLCASS